NGPHSRFPEISTRRIAPRTVWRWRGVQAEGNRGETDRDGIHARVELSGEVREFGRVVEEIVVLKVIEIDEPGVGHRRGEVGRRNPVYEEREQISSDIHVRNPQQPRLQQRESESVGG